MGKDIQRMDKTDYFMTIAQEGTLSYKAVYEEKVKDGDYSGARIISCTINSCSFDKSKFISTDFDGTNLSNCSFTEIKWERTDFCSLVASSCIFRNVDFTFSTMRNCDFKNCEFIQCTFDHIALSGSNFQECNFTGIYLQQSSTYLNKYTNCSFKNCNINGNFYYNLLLDCEYTKSVFEQKLIAYNYFCSAEGEISDIGFSQAERETVRHELLQYTLFIILVLLEWNESNNIDLAVIRFVMAIYKLLDVKILIREEQLSFLRNILEYLLDAQKISAVTIIESLYYIDNLLSTFEANPNEAYQKCKYSLNLIKNTLSNAYEEFGSSISYVSNSSLQDKENQIKIVYEKEPEIPICQVINEIKDSLGIAAPDAFRIKTEQGSFHEWISCYDSILGCLQLFVAVLGLGYSIVKNNSKKKEESDNLPEGLSEGTSAQMLAMLNQAISKRKLNSEFNQTIKIVLKNEIVTSKNFKGYSKSNVCSLEINPPNN